MDREPETLGEIGRRLNALEKRLDDELDDLREIVDGRVPDSHRNRLHKLETDKRAAALVREALDELRAVRASRSNQWREWGSFALAIAALAVAIVLRLHGGH